ncbi:MAG: N-6 DNA methylase [Muribaculaceae bacterium]|nr:N-6 DNA methylase [Muribaculaceae bacterium]
MREGDSSGESNVSSVDNRELLSSFRSSLEEGIRDDSERGDPLLDGYEAMDALMADKNVSQAVRAKAYYRLTGTILPMGTITGYTTVKEGDGRERVNAVTAEGEVVTSRTFSDEKGAEAEKRSIRRQAELNGIDVGERMMEEIADENHRPEAIRKSIKEDTGIEVDDVIRKSPERRTEEEQEALDTYINHLYPEETRTRMKGEEVSEEPTPEQQEAQGLYEQGKLLYGRYEEGDPEAQAEADAIVIRMEEAEQLLEDAFGGESEYYRFHLNENPWDLINNPELTAGQQDAVLYYINSKAALDGVMDASHEAADRKRAEVEQSVEKRTHKDTGAITPATMKVNDRQVYIVKGDVAMYPDGSGVDAHNSSESIVVMDAESGEYEFTSPDQIFSVGESIDPEDEMRTALEAIEQERDAIFGENGVAPTEEPEETPPPMEGNNGDENIPENGNIDAENIPTEGNNDAENVQQIADTEKYDQGYEDGITSAQEYSDERLNDEIEKLRGYGDTLTDFGRGMLEAMEYARQERGMAAKSVPENRESVPNIGENNEIPTENRESFTENVPNSAIPVEDVEENNNGTENNPTYFREYTLSRSGKTIKVKADVAEPDKDGIVKVRFSGDAYDKDGNYINTGSAQHIYIAPEDIYNIEGQEGLDFYNEDGTFSAAELRIAPTGEIAAYDREGVKIWLKRNPLTGEVAKLPSFVKEVETALSRIPLHEETGEPRFTAVDPETGWDGLVEAMEGEANALPIAQQMIEDTNKKLEALNKKPPTPKKPNLAGKAGPMAMRAEQKRVDEANAKAQADYQQALSEAQAEAQAWSNILGVYTNRNAELRRQQEEERRQRDAELHDQAVAQFEEEQRLKAERDAEQDAIGTHAVNPKIKEKWDSANKVEGNPDAITLPDGSTIRGRYVLTEAGAASASHDVNNAYEPTEGFPIDENGQSVNDRDYLRDKDAQRIVEQIAGAYDSRAMQTPVIVSQEGVVLSGNNRTMSGDLAARQGTDKAYVDYLREFGAKYGFTPEQVNGMEHPRLVFVPDEALPYDASTFSRFNAQEMKSQSKPEAAVKLGKIVPDNVFENIVTDISKYDRLSDYYKNEEEITHALGALMQAGVINDKQMPEMRTGTALSAAGKELIENTLIGKVFQTSPDAVRQIISMPTLRQPIVMGLNEIANNRTLARNEYDLSEELSRAVDLVTRAKAAMPDVYTEGMPVSPFGRQEGLFDDEYGDSRVTDATTLLLADMLNSGKPGDLRKVLATYNNEASQSANGQMDLWTGTIPTKEEILTNVNSNLNNGTAKEKQQLVDAAIAARKERAAGIQELGGSEGVEQVEYAGERGEGSEERAGGERTPKSDSISEETSVTHIDPRRMSDEEKSRRGEMLHNAEAIPVEKGMITSRDGKSGRKVAEEWWDNHVGEAIFYDTEAGEVGIDKTSVKDSLSHGYSQEKLDAIASLADGFQNATYLGSIDDFKRPGVKNHYFAYPIEYDGQRKYVFCRAMESNNKNRLYVHEVFMEDTIKKSDSLQTIASASKDGELHGGIALYKAILANVLEKEVHSRPALGSGKDTDTTEVNSGHSMGATAPAGNSSMPSEGKGNTLLSDKQGKGGESSDWMVDARADEMARREDMRVAAMEASYQGMAEDAEGHDAELAELYAERDATREMREAEQDAAETILDAGLAEDEKAPGMLSNFEKIEARDVNINPTEAQKAAGNYKMGHRRIDGYNISIENPKGSVRRGKDANGEEWQTEMHHDYGYIRGTEGVDGDHIDVFLSDTPEEGDVFVIDQRNADGSFDEHKVMYGFPSEEAAREAYLSNYKQGWTGLGAITQVSKDEFKKWVQSSKRKTKPFSEYKSVKGVGGSNAPMPADGIKAEATPASYTITPTKYEGKYKTSDVWLVKFDRDLSKEQKAALDSFSREPLKEGRKTSRGWYDRKQGGYMMRSEEAARQLAEMIGNEEAVADAQPLTAEELREAVETPTDDTLDYKAVTNADDFMKAIRHDWGDTPMVHPVSHGTMLQFIERLIINGHNRTTRQLGNAQQKYAEVDLYPSEEKMLKTAGFSLKQTALTLIDNEGKCAYDIVWHPNQYKGSRSWVSVTKTFFSPEKPKKAPINRVSLEDVMTDLSEKGETRLSDHAETVSPEERPVSTYDKPADAVEKTPAKGQFKVTDEMRAQEDELRRLLGISDEEGSRDVYFRDPDELTPEEKRKVFAIGVNYAFNFLDNGVTSFPDFAKAVVMRLGSKVKPFLKSWYEGAKRVPGYGGEGYTETAEVDRFDVENFDKPTYDAIKDAEMRVAERKAQTAAEQAEKEIKETRNKQRKENDKQREADTVAIGEKAETLAGKAERLAKTSGDRRELNRVSDEIDETIDGINDQLALLGYYEADLDSPEHEVYGLRRSAEKKAVKDAVKLAKQLVDDLGIEIEKVAGKTTEQLHKSRGKNDTAVRANVAQAGGDITVNLPYPDGRNLHISIGLSPTHERGVEPNRGGGAWEGDNYEVDCIMFRFGDGHNHFLPTDVTYGKMLDEIQRAAKWGQPKKQEIKKEESHNGYKRGDEVMWDRNGNGKWEKVKIEDFDADGSPIFESVKGIMSEKGDWSRVKPTDGVFGEAKRVATKAQADKKKKAETSKESERKDAIEQSPRREQLRDGEGKKKTSKKKEIKAEQPVGELFGGLFDEETETPKENEKRNGNKPSQEVAGGERAHTVGDDETGTDGGVPTAGAEPTRKGGTADEKGAGVERGTDSATHGADADGGLQPRLGDRGRNEGNADSGSTGAAVERGGTTGEGSVSKRGADRGGERLSKGEPTTESGRGSGTAAVKKPKKPEVRYTRNFRYDEKEGNEADTYTPSQRLEANVEAIETLAEVLFGDKPATDEQRAVMSRFRGWGQVDLGKYYDIDHILRETYRNTPLNRLAKAIQKLDPQGDKKLFNAIKRASLSSYYTPTPIARAMNTFLGLAGFKGGALLDPSMGNGMYEGTLPKSIQERTAITGVELDWLSGQLSRMLYPDANVIIGGFEKYGIAPGSFDVVTSNVPFGDIVVNDPSWKNDATPVKRSAQNRIHNYYAVKMLEATRPGGLVAMLTTSAVMDTPSNQNIRAHIADQGEILGAIRLPDNTFQGTGVVTDILFIRKWRDDQDRTKTREDSAYKELEQAFLSHFEKTAPNKLDGKKEKVQLNGYFEKNPRNLIGEIQAGNQYGKRDAFGLTSKLSVEEIGSEIEKAIKRIIGSRRGSIFNPTRTIREVQQAVREAYKGEGDWISNGNLVIQDGKVGVHTAKSNEYGEVARTFEGTLKHDKMLPRIKAMIDVRTAMKKLIAGQIEGAKEQNLTALRSELQKAYDNFVGKYGRLQDKDNSFILDDIDGYTIQALERWKNGKFEGLSDIFTKNSIKPALKLDGKKTPQEAVALSLAEYGYLRPDYLAKALGEDWVEQCGDFIFLKPNSEDDYVTRDEYLSGDVVTKLAEARAAAEKDKSFERNVKALEDVQPERIPFDDITIHLGARWIPENILNDFVNDLFGIQALRNSRNGRWDPEKGKYVYNQKSGVRYIPETDSFEINIEKKELGGAAQDWETPRKSAKEILQAALEDKTLLIKRKDKEGNEHIDEEQTELANQKIADLRERFESWLPSDPERVDMLEQTYNDRFNRTVIRHFDGSHLVVPGLMGKELRPHQKDAVWMLINNRGGIVDHIVGAGKTLVMQSAIMEMRRMGIAKKPMIVALKSTVSQIAREFKEAFPSARVLAPNDSDFKKENRKKFIANISLNDYDCVILSHEQYCMLPHTEEAERAVIDEQLWQLNNMIEYLYGTNDTSQMTRKQINALEKRRNNLVAKLEARLDRNVDREFCFENLGIDYMFVDESHQFKSLPYVTSYKEVAGLGDPKGSNRAVALLTGIRHLQRMHQGDKGTVFLSGTTITNSLVEMYNLLNYLRPRKLEELGMPTFDAWASTFAVHSAELEAGVTGNFTMKDRFRNFDNITELSQLYREIADVRDDSNLKLPKPGFDTKTHILKASPVMEEINSEIVKMIENKDGSYFGIHPKDPNHAPWGLHASTTSAKAAVSPRLLFHDADDEGGKVQAVCDNVAKIFRETEEHKGVQLIFCEMGVPGKGKEYDAYTDMVNRFVKDYGISRSEIAYIQEATNDEKRKALFQRVRDGKVRILIGGTKNMGTGVNVQDRITDVHMVTVPWTPSALAQCLGRAGRQGNVVARDFMGNKVRVHYYATEGSLDLYKYQLLDAKGKMISQFKSGAVGRSFDEGSMDEDGNMDPAEMVAILSGNPVIFERAKQEKVVKKLRALRNGFERDYQRKKAKYSELQAREERLSRLVRLNERDRADLAREGFKPDDKGVYPTKFTIMEGYSRYGGRTFDKPKEGGEYLLKMLEDGKDITLQGFGQRAKVVTINEEGAGGLFTSHRVLQIGDGERDIKYTVRLSDDATAAGTAFRNLLKRIIDNGEVYKRDLDETKRQLAGMNIGEGVFPKQAELDEAVAKFRELNAEYNKIGKKPEAGGDGKTQFMDPAPEKEKEKELTGRETDPGLKERKALELSERLGLPIRLNRTAEEVGMLSSGRQRRALGFYSRGEELAGRPGVTINLPNLATVRDVVKAIFHEGVWHKGIRLFCRTEQERDRLMDHLYENSSEGVRKEIEAIEAEIFERAKDELSRDEKFLKGYSKPGERIYAGSPLAVALAHVEARSRRAAGEYMRDATEEFGARVQEEVEEHGYDRMRADKLSFWKRVVNFMDKAMGAILRGLKIRMPWKYGRKEYQAMGSLFESRLREQAAEGPLREAQKVARRYRKEREAEKREKESRKEIWKETAQALTDTKKAPEGKTVAPKDSPSHAEAPGYVPSLPKISDAKVKIISENLKYLEGNIPENGLGKNQIVYAIAESLGIAGESGRSNYSEVNVPGVGETTIRISNHSANPSNFGRVENNVGIVIKTSNQRFRPDEGTDYVELMYYGDKVSGNAGLQKEIVGGLRHYIETGSFEKMPEPDRLNTSGAYRDAVEGLEDKIFFRDPGLGLEETITKMKTEAMQANADNLQAKREAMRAIGGNLNHLRSAMARQREYDITTVKSVSDLARILMEQGLLDDLSKYETKRILSAINNVVGKQDVSRYVQKVMDIM